MFPVQIFRSALRVVRIGTTALRSTAALGNTTNSATGLIKPQPCLQIRPFSSNLISNASALMGKPQPRLVSTAVSSSLPVLASRQASTILTACNNLLVNPSRTIMKNFWPRPRENKRIKNFSWKTRMSTPSGRKIIMRRILKGRHSLTH